MRLTRSLAILAAALVGTAGTVAVAPPALAATLYANRAAIGPWEKFTQYAANTGPGTINAAVSMLNVTAESAGKKPLIANRENPGLREFFYVEI